MASARTILLAEEDPATAGFLADNLIADGYRVLVADDKSAALELLEEQQPDLVLCDVNGDTLQLIDAVRGCDGLASKIAPDTPLIVLSAHADELARVRYFDRGGDDVIAKPFSYPELRARVRALLRRSCERPASARVRVGALTIDPVSRQVHVGEAPVELTKQEFALLHALAGEPTRVFTKANEMQATDGNEPATGGPGRRGRGLNGVGSRLLTTMAIVRSNADQDRDYIANFEPFATDRLKAWPEGEPVAPDTLASAICAEWGVPSLPTAVGKILLRRAEVRGEVVKAEEAWFYPNAHQLAEVPDLAAQKHAMLARMKALARAVVDYAKAVHGLDWSEQHATEALERLSEEFGAELALAKHHGGLAATDLRENEALTVVYGFARQAVESDPTNFDYLVEMVQGTMLVNALYFLDVGHTSNKLKQLRVYLDTSPVLRALGLASDPVCDATRELLTLLRDEFKVPMFVFSHTLDEITGVLDAVAAARRRGHNRRSKQGAFGGRNREAIDAVIRKGWTAGEIDAIVAEIETQIRALGIGITETPPHIEKEQVDEQRLEAILDQNVTYRSAAPRVKDLKSLAAVDRLRGTSRPRDLSQANSLFVTANSAVIRSGREFFREADREAGIPHAMHETALTAQLWVRMPHPAPDLPRKLLIADCYAALNPSPALWERWVAHIVRLQDEGVVTDEQVQTLIYHEQAKSKLFEVTHGDPDSVGDETVTEVLGRFESDLRRPAEEEAAAERALREAAEHAAHTATRERDALRAEVGDLAGRVNKQESDRKNAAEKRRKRRALARTITGITCAVLVVVAFVIVGIVLGAIDGKLGWASAVTLLVLGTTAGVAWAWRLHWKFPLIAVITVGALSSLFVNVFSVVPDDRPGKPPGRTP